MPKNTSNRSTPSGHAEPSAGPPEAAPPDAAPPDATLRVRSSSDLVAAIPYLVGFHPLGSLVLIGLDAVRRGHVVVTARIDLDDVASSAPTLAHTVAGIARGGAAGITAAVFDDDAVPDVGDIAVFGPDRLPWAGLAGEVLETATAFGLYVDDVLLAASGRSWSYLCAEDCCPPEGRPLESSAVPAECTYAGMVALPDRTSLEATLEPLPDAERERLLFALDLAEYDEVGTILGGDADRHDRAVKRALFAAVRKAEAPDAAAIPDEQVVRFGAALQRIAVRDALWMAVDDERLTGTRLWRDLARRLPTPFDAPPLFLFAWAHYRAGNGALAGMAAERALASDPSYSAADLLLAALSQAIDPRIVPRLRMRSRSA